MDREGVWEAEKAWERQRGCERDGEGVEGT